MSETIGSSQFFALESNSYESVMPKTQNQLVGADESRFSNIIEGLSLDDISNTSGKNVASSSSGTQDFTSAAKDILNSSKIGAELYRIQTVGNVIQGGVKSIVGTVKAS